MKRFSQFHVTQNRLPWLLTAVLLLLLLLLIGVGSWRSTSTGAQVQVPMFYDAHYLFPRSWTQAQTAPGVPPPAPVAFYGANTISQPFVSGADHLEMVQVWLAGSAETTVTATLTSTDGQQVQTTFNLNQGQAGGLYALAFPQIAQAEGQTFRLTLSALAASAERPVITHTIGGDKVGGAVQINEYGRPGNLQMYTYVSGASVLAALTEQLLPDIFRQRLQQYKPAPFKGQTFAILFGLLLILTITYLVLARPSGQSLGQAVGWTVVGLLVGLLLWQLGDGRVRLPFVQPSIAMTTVEGTAVSPQNDLRIVNDMILALWTAKREPEERFIETTLADYPAIHVPGDSNVAYALDVPRNGRFQSSIYAEGDGELRFRLQFNDETLAEVTAVAGEPAQPFNVDLTNLAGQGGRLQLRTEILAGQPQGYWQQPQLLAQVDWLLPELPPDVQLAGHRLGEAVSLLAVATKANADGTLSVTLYWQAERPLTENATVFVHLLAENGEMIAQHDAQPVQNSYPLTVWPPGMIVVDEHILPGVDAVSLAVGLYNPTDFSRWPVTNPDGTLAADGRVVLPLEAAP